MRFNPMQLISRGYWDQADDGTGQGGGTGGGSGDGQGDGDGQGTGQGGSGDGQGTGGTRPSDAEAKLLREIMDKKDKLRATQAQVDELSKKLKDFDGIDPVQVRQLLADMEAKKVSDLEAKGQWDALKGQMVTQHAKQVEELGAKLSDAQQATATLQAQIAELTVGNAFGNSTYIASKLDLPPAKIRVLFGSHFEQVDGKVIGYNKPAGEAGRAPLVGADGEALSFDEALDRLVQADPDKDRLLKSQMKPGAASGTAGGAAPVKQEANLSGRERIMAGLLARKK